MTDYEISVILNEEYDTVVIKTIEAQKKKVLEF